MAVVRLLLRAGAMVNEKESDIPTPLWTAARRNRVGVVQVLYVHGCVHGCHSRRSVRVSGGVGAAATAVRIDATGTA